MNKSCVDCKYAEWKDVHCGICGDCVWTIKSIVPRWLGSRDGDLPVVREKISKKRPFVDCPAWEGM